MTYHHVLMLSVVAPALLCGCSASAKPAGMSAAGGDVSAAGTSSNAEGGGRAAVVRPADRIAAGSGGSSGAAGARGAADAGSGGAAISSESGGATGSGGAAGSGVAAGSSVAGSRAGVGGAAGSSSARHAATFAIGADITWVQQDEMRGATYSDGTRRDILQLLADHGFNYIRLRTFVDPRAADGYDKADGFGDLAHTITFGTRVKQAGMGLLIDFHYSDNWADPGKQCVPVVWQNLSSIAALASALHDYTKDAVSQLVAAGARPDMVQIGNEITPGMLLHRCDSDGQPSGSNPVTGTSSDWTKLGPLLEAGSRAVKEVDPSILVMLHIDQCDGLGTSRDFIDNALQRDVAFDVFGESCYTAYQGMPSVWHSTFMQLAAQYPMLKFVIAEYGPEQRAANDVLFNLPNQQGLGTFNWEPTHSGAWNTGHGLFDAQANNYTATNDLALYDIMNAAYADRL